MAKNITQITDYLARSKARLLEQMKGRPRFEALLTSWVDEVQLLENVFFELYHRRPIQNGLLSDDLEDKIGNLVGQQRNGFADDVYAILITARIATNHSDGKRPSLINIAGLLVPDTVIDVREYVGAVTITPLGPVTVPPEVIARDFLRRAVSAGIQMTFIWTGFDLDSTLIYGYSRGGITDPTVAQSPGYLDGGTSGPNYIAGGRMGGAFTYQGGRA